VTERQLAVMNRDVQGFKTGEIMAVIREMPGCFLLSKIDDAVVRVLPHTYRVVKKDEATKLLGVKLVHEEDEPATSIKTEIRESGKLDQDEMNVECSKCGRRYCDCESKY
jgi:hypothetical protein